jgi:hypothetical protein
MAYEYVLDSGVYTGNIYNDISPVLTVRSRASMEGGMVCVE